jgi:rubrerythrin
MSWERWRCPTCGWTVELNEESPLQAWCPSCRVSMAVDDDEGEA